MMRNIVAINTAGWEIVKDGVIIRDKKDITADELKCMALDSEVRVFITNHISVEKYLVRLDMQYCFRFGRFRPNPRTKHISVPPRHMTESYIPDFNTISQHYRYKDTTSHTIGIQLPEYNTSVEDTCLGTDYNQMPRWQR